MNSKQISSVRRAISRARNAGGRLRYSAFVKNTVTSWITSGQSLSEISALIGIGPQTLMAWSIGIENKFRMLDVTADQPIAQTVAVTLSNGVEISCSSIDLLIDTLERFK